MPRPGQFGVAEAGEEHRTEPKARRLTDIPVSSRKGTALDGEIQRDGFTGVGIEFAGHGSNRVRPAALGRSGHLWRSPQVCHFNRFRSRCRPGRAPKVYEKKEMRENEVLQKVSAGSRLNQTFRFLIGAQSCLFVRYKRPARRTRRATATKPERFLSTSFGSAAHIRKAATSSAM